MKRDEGTFPFMMVSNDISVFDGISWVKINISGYDKH